MSLERHARVKQLFLRACELQPEERPAFLDETCGDDDALRREVASLLEFHGETCSDSSSETSRHGVFRPAAPPPERIAGYRVLERIGEGGMGVVYEAEQLEPVRRRVALKVIKAGMDTRQVVARFESERQALALMDHPYIARIFDAGETERGRPFFAMEFVSGEPITDYCDRQRLGIGERLELFIEVCEAVQHAHQRGIIHRDIKPSNVMVRILDDRPVPTIIDFGIAKATQQRPGDTKIRTAIGVMMGTPEYMSPEQAQMSFDVDTRTDVYSLGVLLYELLVGALPFDSRKLREAGLDDLRRRIREEEPSKPSARVATLGEASQETAQRRRTDPPGLRRQLCGDLDWITLRALEKDRTRRYASPSELAADVTRHLRDQPVAASPPSTIYRTRKFVRRHRVGVVAVGALIVALLGGVIGTTVGLVQAKREAETARRVSRFLKGVFRDLNPNVWSGSVTTPEQMLDRGLERLDLELDDQPLIRADLMLTLGAAYQGLGMFERARPLYEGSAAIRLEHLGPEHLDYALSISSLADLLSMTGSYEEARRLHEQALATRRRALGSDHPLVGSSLRSLGWLHWRAGDLETARVSYEQALDINEKSLGPDALELASTLRLLSQVDLDEGDYDAARASLERALEIREESVGPEHPAVALVRSDLGRVYIRAGDRVTALGLFERALATDERLLGPEHPRLAQPVQNIARIHLANGNHDGARAGFERALRILENALGPRHPDVARARSDLGYLEHASGNYGEARRQFQRTLELQRETYGPTHRAVSHTLYNLACLSALEGQKEQALELLREAVDSGFDGRAIFQDPDLAALRGDPDFDALVETVRRRLSSVPAEPTNGQ